MKKIALCLYGKFNNRLSETSGEEGFKYILENIIKGRDVDVFIHSWDLENKERILELYKDFIKDQKFEAQIDFKPIMNEAGIDEEFFNAPGGQSFRTIANSFSFFYTRAESIKLKKAFEEKNGMTYDSVICSRFDLAQMDKYNGFQAWKASEMAFDENLDMNYFYSSMWHQLNAGYTDMWFFSSSKNMDKIILMFDKTKEYLRKDSDYIKALTTGWPDSNADDSFSNEFFKENKDKSTKLKTYQAQDAHNNHIMHKWFFMDVGLYEISKFTEVPSTKFCTAMYSHSDYSDVWPLYFGQNKKHSKFMGPKFLFVNKKMDNVPSDYEQIIYDENQSYPEKVAFCLKVLKSRGFEACLFEHEDMVLYDDINYDKIKLAINMVLKPGSGKPFRNGYDSIRLIKAANSYSIRSLEDKDIHYMLPFSKWLYSVQPTIWKIDSFIKMLEPNYGDSIWGLELNAQKTCRKLGLKCGYAHNDGRKAGLHHWDNSIYPYVATAIVKGKWNTSEYNEILPPLLKKYEIESSQRGTF